MEEKDNWLSKNESRRQASATIREYAYQILNSVYAWLELKDDESLFLESAEDFDAVADEKATVAQVKD
ncbi:MAG: hypothetical protein JW957_04825 [Candidatus Omnitrophica bacterium]|nr:hypothetical protein [Candidatus Omnitrophota bacterium]